MTYLLACRGTMCFNYWSVN